jgi:hypothetical protein
MHAYSLLAAIDKPHRLNLLHVYVTTIFSALGRILLAFREVNLEIGMQLDTLDEHSS